MKKEFNLMKVKISPIKDDDQNVLLSFCTVDNTPVINMTIEKSSIPDLTGEKEISGEDLIAFVQLLFYGHVNLLNNWLTFGQYILSNESYSEEDLQKLINFTKYTLGYNEENE